MRTTALAAAYILAAGSAAQAQPAEDMSANPILREYRSKLPLLVERYSTNRKIRVRSIGYVVDPRPGERIGDEVSNIVRETITDGLQMKEVTLESKWTNPILDQNRINNDDRFWKPEIRFNVGRTGVQFKIAEENLARTNYYVHETAKYWWYAHTPMTAGGFVGTSLWFDERGHNSVIVTVVDIKPATRNGRECVEVRSQWDNRHGMVELSSTYLDPSNDYIAIATETDWATETFFGTDPPPSRHYKRLAEIVYQPSAEGFPLPKFVRGTFQIQGGAVRKVYDLEFLSYEKYVPSPEEFQLEKAYGIPTPVVLPEKVKSTSTAEPEPPAPAAPEEESPVWPWVAVASAVMVVVVADFAIRRYRKKEAPPS